MGQWLTITQAANKYNLNRPTLVRWIKAGKITTKRDMYIAVRDDKKLAACLAAHSAWHTGSRGFGLVK
jgi:hypothetical protein